MKRLLIIIILLCALGLFLRSLIPQDEVEARIPVETKLIEEMTVSGNSMTGYGFDDGDIIDVKIQKRCEVGDICVFVCNSKKCGTQKGERVFKSLRYIDENGYYFEGTIEDFPCALNSPKLCYSNDSREWGQLRSSDIQVVGVVL